MCPELSSLTQHALQRCGAVSAQDGHMLLMSGKSREVGVGDQADAMMLLYILLSVVSLSAHCCHQFENGFFF